MRALFSSSSYPKATSSQGVHIPRIVVLVALLEMMALVHGCSDCQSRPFEPVDPLPSVDPIIGTAGAAFGQPQTFVGATTPFGLVKLGPDTSGELPREVGGFAHTSGYWYLDTFIDGFSHLHLSGTGVEDLGNFLLMPATSVSEATTQEDGYRQTFSHNTEEVSPGRYAVRLEESGVYAELTASRHAGMHHYRFPDDAPETNLIIDVSHGLGKNGSLNASMRYTGAGNFVGWMENAGRFTSAERSFPIYVSLTVTPEPDVVGGWTEAEFLPEIDATAGEDIGMFARFPAGTTDLYVQVGVSLIDEEQATWNRKSIEGRSFDEIYDAAQMEWETWLSRIRVEGADESTNRIFYTSLYHSALMPTQYSEPNPTRPESGRYVGLDRAIYEDEGTHYYSDFSLWDTYRSAHPLYALIAPELASNFSTSLLRMTRAHGVLPRWPLVVNETGTMLGSPAILVWTDSWLRGARDFDVDEAISFALDDANSVPEKTSRRGHDQCVAAGFCPKDLVGRGVAHAAEWGAADFALSQLLHAQGQQMEAETFATQSLVFVGHLDPETGFARGRAQDGSFSPADEFDAADFTEDYAEGNAWQYLFSAPHALAAMARNLGEERLLEQVHALFSQAQQTPPRYLTDEWRQPDPYYWHGNEPDLFAAFVPLLLGDVDSTTRYVNWILDTKYDDTPLGLDGNDDGGTLSSWYVLAAMGLFPLPGSDVWLCVPPRFSQLRIQRAGEPLAIEVEKSSADAGYIQRIEMDGKPLHRPWMYHSELTNTKVLRFFLADNPVVFGADAARLPLPVSP